MIAGVSVTTLLLVLVAGIGAGSAGYAVGASSPISSYPALLAFGIPPGVIEHDQHRRRGRHRHRRSAGGAELANGQRTRVIVYALIGLVGGIIGGLLLLLELPAEV